MSQKNSNSNEENSSIEKDTLLNSGIISTSSDIIKTSSITNESRDLDGKINENKKEKNFDDTSMLKKIEDERIKTEEEDEDDNDEKKKTIFIDPTDEKIEFLEKKAKMRTHYYKNADEEIFSYRYKGNSGKEPYLFYCCKENMKCGGKIRFYNYFSSIKFEGYHDHYDGIDKTRFFKKYPFLNKEIWKHVQIFEMKNKVIIVRVK